MNVNPEATLRDTETSVIGVNQIGLSVADIDAALAFYRKATAFELISDEHFVGNEDADRLFGAPGRDCRIAVLKAPNMLLELIEFASNRGVSRERMAAKGPGMTHTCYQSPIEEPGWNKFIDAGATPLTWGGEPVDLGGYGVTYGYAHDPEGNMMELEQLDGEILKHSGYDETWKARGDVLWMTQVALVTHDLDRLMTFYQAVLGIEPYRKSEVRDNPRADRIVGYDNSHVLAGWFRLNEYSKVLELWQYVNPVTEASNVERKVSDLGYSFALEVTDIQAEFQRLRALDVHCVSEPVQLGAFTQFYAFDVDGNPFSLRQAVNPGSDLSVRVLDLD